MWNVSPDDRPAELIAGLAELWSAHRIDETGSIASQDVNEYSRLWARLWEKYPAQFTISPESVRRWREGEMRDCMKERNLRAAEFHYWALFAELASGKAR
jgi:hypothetical protein